MTKLTLAETETHLNMTADDRSVWIVFSDDPVMMRRLDRIGEFVRVVGAGKEYRLSATQVTLRAKKKPLSDEQKARLAQQFTRHAKNAVAVG